MLSGTKQERKLEDKRSVEELIRDAEFEKAAYAVAESGQINQALKLCKEKGLILTGAEILEKSASFDEAKSWYIEANNPSKLLDFYTRNEKYELAADLLMKQRLFEQAAGNYQKAKLFEKSAQIYASLNRYMNAIMCYQKAGNVEKQMEMQVAAFDYDYELTDGDLAAIPMSLAMAVLAAKHYLNLPEMRERAFEILEKAQALRETAQSYFEEGNNELAAILFLRLNALPEAARAFEKAGNHRKAADIYRALGNSDEEMRMLAQSQDYLKIARRLISLKRLGDALKVLARVRDNSNDFIEATELQGDILCKQKEFAQASLYYEKIKDKIPNHEQSLKVFYKLAYCFEATNDYDTALSHYLHVYKIDPAFRDIGERVAVLTAKQAAKRETQASNQVQAVAPPLQPLQSQAIRARQPSVERRRVRTIGSGVFVSLDDIPANESERYHIIEEAARGGMGVVYKATDLILNRTVALKVLSQKLKDNDVAREYFIREARASAQLQHINIVTIFDIGKLPSGDVYLAMEFIDGKTLKQLITQTGPFPTKFLTQLSIHACRGLQYAHDNGIVHRDVKSGNMMLAKKDKTLKILDLGLAKVLDEGEEEYTQAIGTPYYMSPEQVLGNEIDERSDIYSLGVTLYELATGSLPFLKGDLPYKHVHEAPPLPSSVNPQTNPKLEAIILKCMNKNPNDRYSSCNELIQAFKTIEF